jgi:hypothetical protein
LKHDLGKYVRFNAPETMEADDAALRERLRRDLLATRETPEGTRTAVEVFREWASEDREVLEAAGFEEAVSSVEREIEVIERLLPRVDALSRTDLVALDDSTRRVQAACVEIFRAAAARVPPHGGAA